MTIRKCVYTGGEAKSKDSVLPKKVLGEESHNWTLHVPCNTDYKAQKGDKLPTELELQAHELFHLVELSKLRTSYYEAKLAEVQAKILEAFAVPDPAKPTKSVKIKEEQIKKAIVQKEVLEENKKDMDQFFEKKRALWDKDDDENSDD
jgi:hypothetical protein